MKMRMKILSVTVLSLAVVGGAHAKDKIASRLKTPHPRASDARSRGIKFPISNAMSDIEQFGFRHSLP
jgi:hypothetical protein